MSDLLGRFNRIGRPKVLVFGDLMLDRYIWGDAERISPEAPVIVLRADHEDVRPGGAASVAYLLRHLDASVSVAGFVGNDSDGHVLRALLRDEGIDDKLVLLDESRPTTTKRRFVGRASDRHPHQILRVDHESRCSVSDSLVAELWQLIEQQLSEFDAVLIADYLKGTCTERLLQEIIQAAKRISVPVLVDPGRTANFQRYRGATLLKPNRAEAERILGQPISSTERALRVAELLVSECDLSAAIITLDRDGMVLLSKGIQEIISAIPKSVYDITGAGDMVLAMLGLCMASGVDLSEAAHIANIAAGLEVECFGISAVSRAEVSKRLLPDVSRSLSKILGLDDMIHLAGEYHRQGKTIVFTNGCFDLLHIGHVTCLEDAAKLGDVLIVATNSDDSVRRLKGPTRPVVRDVDRARMLAALECVKHVVIFDEDTPSSLISRVLPDVLAKGGTTDVIVGREIVESNGGKVWSLPAVAGISTTRLIGSIQHVCHVQEK